MRAKPIGFYHAVKNVIDKLPYHFEFCFVNDGSKDDTLAVIRTLAKKDESVKYLSFSRNFGQQVALKAGIDSINADAIIHDGQRLAASSRNDS